MNKKRGTFLVLPFLIIILASCTTAKSGKANDLSEGGLYSSTELDRANQQYAKEVESYRSSMEIDLRNNRVLITELRDEKSDGKTESMIIRNAKIDSLQKRNEELEKRMNGYKCDDKENWKFFKREFNKDMSELGKAFKDIAGNNLN